MRAVQNQINGESGKYHHTQTGFNQTQEFAHGKMANMAGTDQNQKGYVKGFPGSRHLNQPTYVNKRGSTTSAEHSFD